MTKVIVISGPPASGKTTLSITLSEKLGLPILAKDTIKESLLDSLHAKGPHGMGMILGSDGNTLSVHHNLFAHNNDRHPLLGPMDGAKAPTLPFVAAFTVAVADPAATAQLLDGNGVPFAQTARGLVVPAAADSLTPTAGQKSRTCKSLRASSTSLQNRAIVSMPWA